MRIRGILFVSCCYLMTLSSCYVTPTQIYLGRDTLPEVASQYDSDGNFRRIPRVYQIQHLPAPSFTPELMARPEIQAELRHFINKDPRFIRESFARRAEYHDTLKQIFVDEGVPRELLSLALVESGYRPRVKSHRGAAGMWQFMKPTAKSYGLSVSFLNDQRTDPILSTIAAARMLRDLYQAYEDWPLSLAAYNAGPARVDRALIKTGSEDFWGLVEKKALSKETRRFVPKVLAVAIIDKSPERYGFSAAQSSGSEI